MIYNTFHPIKHFIPILALGLYIVHAEKFSPIYSVYKVVLIFFSALFGGGGFKSLTSCFGHVILDLNQRDIIMQKNLVSAKQRTTCIKNIV